MWKIERVNFTLSIESLNDYVQSFQTNEDFGLTNQPSGSATLRPGTTLTWIFFLYNNLKFFICLPFKKDLKTPLIFFMPIKLNFAQFVLQWMNDCLIVYIERDITCSIDNKTIIQRFQNIKTHKKVIVNFIYLHVFFISVVVNIWISLV